MNFAITLVVEVMLLIMGTMLGFLASWILITLVCVSLVGVALWFGKMFIPAKT